MEEFIIQAFFFLQEARIWGGTNGHIVGPIWCSQKSTKEKYQEEILKLSFLKKLLIS
jgi:hypothetical protein